MKQHTSKKIAALLCAFVVLLLTGCAPAVSAVDKIQILDEIDYDAIYSLTEADMDTGAQNAKEIIFEKGQAVFVIDKPGDYLLKGKAEGQVQIDVQDEIVHLILDNVELQAPNGPAIYVKSAAKVVITIPEESSSILMDSPYYDSFADAKACVYSVGDLTINGGGSLQVYGYYEDAIRTKDVLKVLDIDLAVQAKGEGLRGNDGVALQTRGLDIQCEGTGIFTEKEDKENRGFVDLAAGTVKIIAGNYGIEAAENLYIHDCKADIYGIVQNLTCQGEQYVEEGCLE